MKIEGELVELWCAEMHNRNTCMGQYYSEDDWSIKRYAKSAEKLSAKVLEAMAELELDGIDITKVTAIEYDGQYYLGGEQSDAEKEFKEILGIKYYTGDYFKTHPENLARLEREKIARKERQEREAREREAERERLKRESEKRKEKAIQLSASATMQELLKMAESQGLKVEIK